MCVKSIFMNNSELWTITTKTEKKHKFFPSKTPTKNAQHQMAKTNYKRRPLLQNKRHGQISLQNKAFDGSDIHYARKNGDNRINMTCGTSTG